MAVVERTIISGGGGNYTTIAAWEAATNLNGGADIWKGVISDNAAYDESVIIDGGGTNNTTSYVWLTVASANRHVGTWDTGKARITYTGVNTAAIELRSDYVMLEWLQIHRPASGSLGTSDEGIRVTSTADTGCLISRCLIWSDDSTTNDTDGLYTGNYAITSLYVDHCIIYGWNRGGAHWQNYNGTNSQTIYQDHCAIGYCGESSEEEGAALSIRPEQIGSAVTVNTYNSWYLGDRAGDDPHVNNDINVFNDAGGVGTGTLNGSHNAFNSISTTDTTNNLTNSQTPTSTVPVGTDTASEVIVTDDAIATTATDFTPQDLANNVLLTSGTDRQGSEPDARQDFSVDIAGNSRGTTDVDIGPWQISGGGGASLQETVNDAGTAGDTVSTGILGSSTGTLSLLAGMM